MAERALAHSKVRPVWNAIVTEVLGDDDHGVTGVRHRERSEGSVSSTPDEVHRCVHVRKFESTRCACGFALFCHFVTLSCDAEIDGIA